jgi:hypothetical protein
MTHIPSAPKPVYSSECLPCGLWVAHGPVPKHSCSQVLRARVGALRAALYDVRLVPSLPEAVHKIAKEALDADDTPGPHEVPSGVKSRSK